MYPPVYAKHKLSNNISLVKNSLTAISVKKKKWTNMKYSQNDFSQDIVEPNIYKSCKCNFKSQIVIKVTIIFIVLYLKLILKPILWINLYFICF